jgi:predicted regulator of Ras-like GTPase activity (Roadblock/LC7/MglB family)
MRPLSDSEIVACKRALLALVNDTSGVEAAVLASPDGFEVVSATRVRRIDGPRLAAMSSSILALGTALANELKLDACRNMHIDAGQGLVLLLTVPCARIELVLSALAPKDTTLGMMLMATRRCADAIGQRLDRPPKSSGKRESQ